MPTTRTLTIASWSARAVVAGILTMGVIPKFTGGAGMLAEVLPGGMAAVLAIGIAEAVAIALLLTPRLALLGASLASLLMLGAVGSHVVGPVGMEGDLGGMFPMALIALLAAGAGLGLEFKRQGGCAACGCGRGGCKPASEVRS